MSGPADDSLTLTAGGDAAPGSLEAPMAIVRWVHPMRGAVTVLLDSPVVVGRDPDAGTRLDGGQVSRRHAELRLVSGLCEVRDLGSKNGVFVNGERVNTAVAKPGDVLRLGDCVGVVERVLPDGLGGFGDLGHGVFGGAALRRVVQRAKIAASSNLNVVLLGETGTGKERFARAIHAFSGRSGAFLAVNSAVYSESTAAAELFGYRKGAFTGAERASAGHVRAADGGTLLLDEILDLPLDLQAKLLRVLEQREVLPLGETQPVPVDVAFVAATQAPLKDAVASGRFRADLRARLEGLVLELPALRQRRSDVAPLFVELLARHAEGAPPKLEAKLVEELCLHDWPMNVRELENVARRLLALHPGEAELRAIHLAEVLDTESVEPEDGEREAGAERARAARRSGPPAYSAEELRALEAAIARHSGNLTKAADELGITRPRAYRMLRAAKPSS